MSTEPAPGVAPADASAARRLLVAASRAGGALPDGLEAELAAELGEVRRRWPEAPTLDEAGEAFAAVLAPRLAPGMAIAEVFLAWWCSTGAPAALQAFEREHGPELVRLAARFRDLPTDELLQHLRIKLFLGEGGAAPRILEYRGRGSLRSWLRVTAVRTFVDLQRAHGPRLRERELEDSELVWDPRGGQVGREVVAAVKRAFASAVATLAPRERVFLRHVYVDRHTLEQIAATYSIHRATVARVLAAARAHLIEQTRTIAAVELGGGEELSSAIRALQSQVELSLSRVLVP